MLPLKRTSTEINTDNTLWYMPALVFAILSIFVEIEMNSDNTGSFRNRVLDFHFSPRMLPLKRTSTEINTDNTLWYMPALVLAILSIFVEIEMNSDNTGSFRNRVLDFHFSPPACTSSW